MAFLPKRPVNAGEGARIRVPSTRSDAGGAAKKYVGDHRSAITPTQRKELSGITKKKIKVKRNGPLQEHNYTASNTTGTKEKKHGNTQRFQSFGHGNDVNAYGGTERNIVGSNSSVNAGERSASGTLNNEESSYRGTGHEAQGSEVSSSGDAQGAQNEALDAGTGEEKSAQEIAAHLLENKPSKVRPPRTREDAHKALEQALASNPLLAIVPRNGATMLTCPACNLVVIDATDIICDDCAIKRSERKKANDRNNSLDNSNSNLHAISASVEQARQGGSSEALAGSGDSYVPGANSREVRGGNDLEALRARRPLHETEAKPVCEKHGKKYRYLGRNIPMPARGSWATAELIKYAQERGDKNVPVLECPKGRKACPFVPISESLIQYFPADIQEYYRLRTRRDEDVERAVSGAAGSDNAEASSSLASSPRGYEHKGSAVSSETQRADAALPNTSSAALNTPSETVNDNTKGRMGDDPRADSDNGHIKYAPAGGKRERNNRNGDSTESTDEGLGGTHSSLSVGSVQGGAAERQNLVSFTRPPEGVKEDGDVNTRRDRTNALPRAEATGGTSMGGGGSSSGGATAGDSTELPMLSGYNSVLARGINNINQRQHNTTEKSNTDATAGREDEGESSLASPLPHPESNPLVPQVVSSRPLIPSSSAQLTEKKGRRRLEMLDLSPQDQGRLAGVLSLPGMTCGRCPEPVTQVCSRYTPDVPEMQCYYEKDYAALSLLDPNNAILVKFRIVDLQVKRALHAAMAEEVMHPGILDSVISNQLTLAMRSVTELEDRYPAMFGREITPTQKTSVSFTATQEGPANSGKPDLLLTMIERVAARSAPEERKAEPLLVESVKDGTT